MLSGAKKKKKSQHKQESGLSVLGEGREANQKEGFVQCKIFLA